MNIAIFVLGALISILGGAQEAMLATHYFLFAALGTMIGLYSLELIRWRPSLGANISSYVFLTPFVFIFGIPFTFGNIFLSSSWSFIYLDKGVLVLILTIGLLLFPYLRFYADFKGITLRSDTPGSSVLIASTREMIWLVAILALSVMSFMYVGIYY